MPYEELTYYVAGINHQAWFLKLRQGKEDLYPRLRACLDDPATLGKDRVRFEMMRFFDYFVTESTKHCSEYHPYFRRTEELRERYGLEQWIASEQERVREWTPDDAPLPTLGAVRRVRRRDHPRHADGRAVRLQRQRDERRA